LIQLRTWQFIPEDSELHTRRRDNLKSHTFTAHVKLSKKKNWIWKHVQTSVSHWQTTYTLWEMISNDLKTYEKTSSPILSTKKPSPAS
jgi:hypothetical protein